MTPTLRIALLWIAFAVSHVALSSLALRPRIVARIGERAFQGLYSLLALALFIPMVTTYFRNKHAGPWLWVIERGPALRWIVILGMGVAFVMMTSALLRPSPAAVVPGDPTPRGIYRITRHPLIMSFALFGLLHLLPNGSTADVAFFGGFVAFTLVGCWHQDRRKLATAGDAFRRFHASTPFLPFTGRDTLRGLRELSPVAVAIGIALTTALRWFHGSLFGP
jgi:uncharacterized membrane protein